MLPPSPKRFLTLLFLLCAVVGCGEAKPARLQVHPVTGTVTFKNLPASGAVLTLHPKSPPGADVPKPRANIRPDGQFAVSTYDGGDGAPEGEYVLTVRWYKPVKNGADVQAGPNVIPPKYAKPETSDKVVIITAGQNDLGAIRL